MTVVSAHIVGSTVEAADDRAVPWWSFTKTVLAAAALVLVERGKLTLDGAFDGRSFTLRQLLNHTAGLPDYGSLAAYHAAVAAGEQPWPAQELLARGAASTAPGRFAYSNIGYLLLRQAIERTLDLELGEALRHLVLAPLGMVQTAIAQTPDDLAASAWGNARRYHPGWVYHGLLVGPPAEAALLLQRLLRGELLNVPLLREMITPVVDIGPLPGRPYRTLGYGLGVAIADGGLGLMIGHNGQGPGSTAAIFHFVERDVGVALFVDRDGDAALAELEQRVVTLARD